MCHDPPIAKMELTVFFIIRLTCQFHLKWVARVVEKNISCRVNFNWLWSKARCIHRKQTNDPNADVRKHVIAIFIKRSSLKLRARQRNRRYSKDSFRQSLMQWHATTRERLVRKGANDNFHPKWGRFVPSQKFNVDQSPLPFAMDVKRTYEHLEKGNPENRTKKVWISQPQSGLDNVHFKYVSAQRIPNPRSL